LKERHHIPRSIMNHPPSNYGDAPPAYLNHDAGSYLSDPESPTNASRLNGATMRLLPSGDGADDLASSHRAPSPSHYDPDYEHTPYVLPNSLSTLSVFTFQWSPSRRSHVHHQIQLLHWPEGEAGGKLRLRQLPVNGIAAGLEPTPSMLFGRSSSP
jgi:hypothetical protein